MDFFLSQNVKGASSSPCVLAIEEIKSSCLYFFFVNFNLFLLLPFHKYSDGVLSCVIKMSFIARQKEEALLEIIAEERTTLANESNNDFCDGVYNFVML